jgi:hypothetical protein
MSSPTSTGPAGAHFEGKVGAHYLLSMLVDAAPRGLPGTTIDKIELQRASQEMFLDDIVVRAHDRSGATALSEIQVKRTITFSPKDPVFQSVVEQIAKAAAKPEFWTTNHQLAIATSATSRKIDGPYQDVLTWARQIGDAATFFGQIERAGTSNEDMRSFVETFRTHLREAGVAHDDETVWRLLSRLHILIFDFTAPASSAQELAQERCARALTPAEAGRAGDLWKALTDIALETAAAAGDKDRNRLLADLQTFSFQLEPLSSNAAALRALTELSHSALEDIGDSVSGASLGRLGYVSLVHAALEEHRYVEIRGEAGVGKSAVLRHFAEQASAESPVLVLTPDRTPGGGWLELRSRLGYHGDCRDLVCDLARNGGATIFIDNLDLFPKETRKTVVDILRQAEDVPGLSVVATARREFGALESSWLPKSIVAKMQPANPVHIDELSEEETDELRNAAPRLGWLLSENHAARAVTRNLYRLSRLSALSPNVDVPLSEAEMARRWWTVADGEHDALYIDRARLLQSLARQVIQRESGLDTSGHPSAAINALVRNETLSMLGVDRVRFKHDVLREWAAANLLFSEPATLDLLPTHEAPSPDLARAIELAARMSIERSDDGDAWFALLQRFSADGVNPLWRRAILLSLARSELAPELLTKAEVFLFDNDAALLRELIRTAMAVDSEPAAKYFVIKEPEKGKIPDGFNIPSGPSWSRLIRWIIAVRSRLPVAAFPDIAKMFGDWSLAMMGQDPLTPAMIRLVYSWLSTMEHRADPQHAPLRSGLDDLQWESLVSELRQTFLLFCNRTPDLAAQYLKSFADRPHPQHAMLELLKFRGALAQAAPAELANFTAQALIPPPAEPDSRRRRNSAMDGPFGFADTQFHPVSPSQGPFFDLLTAAPAEGLALIRRVVDHAVTFASQGLEPGEDDITIQFPKGPRAFSLGYSYAWSREASDAPGVVTSALMALEWWAHQRVVAGESIETMIDDILGDGAVSAAYLLIAVDLLISHWPHSREAAVPFLGSPELLAMDRGRIAFDKVEEFPNPFNFLRLRKEPIGLASVKDLDQLPSRSHMLDELLGAHSNYLEPAGNDALLRLRSLLEASVKTLGPPDANSGLLDPREMVRHALNRLDASNWHPVEYQMEDGSTATIPTYTSPAIEAAHHAALSEGSSQRRNDAEMTKILSKLIDLPGRATAEFLVPAVEWAQRKQAEIAPDSVDAGWVKQQAIYTVAMLCARDGGPQLREQFRDWLLGTFRQALTEEEDSVHRVRPGLRYNPPAMALLGLIHLLEEQQSSEEIREVLAVAGRFNPAAARGLEACAPHLASIDERLPRAILRTAFKAMNKPDRDWHAEEKEHHMRLEAARVAVREHIELELSWLEGRGQEPLWPPFVQQSPHLSFGRRDRRMADEEETSKTSHTDSQGAGLWLAAIEEVIDTPALSWLLELVSAYKAWTKTANGAGFGSDDQISGEPDDWNNAFFKVLPLSLVGADKRQIESVLAEHFTGLPEQSFYDLMTLFQRNVDHVYFGTTLLPEETAVTVRSWFSATLRETNDWKWLKGQRKEGAEIHLAAAISTLFFVQSGGFLERSKAYLFEKGVDGLGPFLPTLREAVTDNPSPYVGDTLLILLEVSPRVEHMELLLACADTWMPVYRGNSLFWREYRFGQRWCLTMRKIMARDSSGLRRGSPHRQNLDQVLAYLVSEGIPEAGQFEAALNALDGETSATPG